MFIFRTPDVEAFTIYPWITHFSNNKSQANQIRPVKFPDVNPSLLSNDGNFSMVAGDFLEVYTEEGTS